MTREITLVPGDTPDLFRPIHPLLEAAGADITFDSPGANATEESMLASARRTGVLLMGPAVAGQGERTPVVALRESLGVTSNLRPVHNLRGLPCRAQNVDLVVVRETTEDIYAHLEHESIPGTFESLKVTTQAACERIARTAFAFARKHGRKKVTIVHKANIMKLSDGMFLREAQAVAAEYPDIECEDVIVDALCMKLILHPERFDVLVCGNLFGDIIADLCAGLVGGISNAPSINQSPDCTMFTTGHRINRADASSNPLTVLIPIVHLLKHIDQADAATKLQTALEATLAEGILPADLGGSTDGDAFCAAVLSHLSA